MKTLAALSFAALLLSPAPALAAPKVVATIKPVHSLVAAVMGDVGAPDLLVKGGASPHTYALRPSDAAALEAADLVFWTGPGMEVFLEGTLATLAASAEAVDLSATPGLVTYPNREGGTFESHDHGDGHEEPADEHAHEEHEQDEHAGEEHEHHHDEGAFDMHYWLDPVNAEAMIEVIAEKLAISDPENAATYAANAAAEIAELRALSGEIEAALAAVRDKPFVVFHDALQYFERRFGLTIAGSVTINPEVAAGAQRLDELRARVIELGATCVFAEPQFAPAVVNAIIENTPARSGTLDPEGSLLTEGPDLYPQLLRSLVTSLTECLAA